MLEKYTYIYTAYELNIQSQIQLPQLLLANDNGSFHPDITIAYGKVSKNIKQTIQEGKNFNFEKNEMWFSIKKVAIYYIYNGEKIIVEPYEGYNRSHLQIFLLGSAFGMLLLQRNNVAIHGSTIVINGQSVIFTGLSGAGKSTLSVALRNRGYGFLADDISAIGINHDGKFAVKPGFPQQKLCKDAMIKMGYDIYKFVRVNDDRDKYALPVGNLFSKKSVPLTAIFELSVDNVDSVQIISVIGSEKILRLMKNIFLIDVTKHSGMESSYFKKCVEIASRTPYYRIIRPREGFSVEEQIGLVIQKLG